MSPSSLLDTRFERVLPRTILSNDLNVIDERPAKVTLPYDVDSDMIFLNIEGWCELAVWVAVKEIVLYARHLKINGHWCEKHCSELDDVLFGLTQGLEMRGDLLIYDGANNGYIPFTQFLWLHSNKYIKRGDEYFVVEREGNHVDNGCALQGDDGGIVVVDMFADGTQFYPADGSASVESIEEDNDSISSISSWSTASEMYDEEFETFWNDYYMVNF